jgi:hypothetical protein
VIVRRSVTIPLGSALMLLGLALQLPVSTASRASTPTPAATGIGLPSTPAFTGNETIARDNVNADGTDDIVDTRNFTVTVDRDTDLRGNQQLLVNWTGAHPTGGIVGDESSSKAAGFEEYPVVLMECRGVDSSLAPAAQQLSPETCWTQTTSERYNEDNNSAFPAWRLDRYATAADTAQNAGAPDPLNPACSVDKPDAARWVPFVADDGTVYNPGYISGGAGCSSLAPEASDVENAGSPGNTTYAVTDPDGNGAAKFVVWTANENASLGCTDTVPCALVVIPIMGISCAAPAAVGQSAKDDTACRSPGLYPPGQPANTATSDPTVTGDLWWSASNWRNRVTVPLTFAESSDVCSVVSHSNPVLMYGSPPMAEATEQWAPYFCTDPTKFTFRHVQTGEPSAKNLLGLGLETGATSSTSASPSASTSALSSPSPTASDSNATATASNGVEAALESDAPPDGFLSPTVQAPVALTGFAISYIIDDSSGHEYTNLKLTPRLLAKLMTESYPDISPVYNSYTALSNNPVNITRDPEFIALNPGIPQLSDGHDAAATLYSLSSNADTMFALTSYINADPEARAWLNGTPDPWGMVVNPNYRGISLPVESWPLLDSFIASFGHAGNNDCIDDAPVPYLPLVASPTSTLSAIAQALQYASPLSQTTCVLGGGSEGSLGNKLTTSGRQIPGTRFMVGLTSLGDAAYYSLDTAALQTYQVAPDPTARFTSSVGRLFASPTDDSLIAAAKLASPDEATGTWPIPYGAMRDNPSDAAAYPGTMFVYLAVPSMGLPTADAADFASFVRFAATTGQSPGFGNGQLPPGYAPMTIADGLGDQVGFAIRAAAAIASQSGQVPTLLGADEPLVSAPPSPAPISASGSASVAPTRGVAAQPAAPAKAQTAPSVSSSYTPPTSTSLATQSAAATSSEPATIRGTTVASSSTLAGSALPTVLAIGLGMMLLASGLRFKVRRP